MDLTVYLARVLGLFLILTGAAMALRRRYFMPVIAGFVVMLGQAARLEDEPWWKGSVLMPAAEEMAGVLRSYVETSRTVVERQVARPS